MKRVIRYEIESVEVQIDKRERVQTTYRLVRLDEACADGLGAPGGMRSLWWTEEGPMQIRPGTTVTLTMEVAPEHSS